MAKEHHLSLVNILKNMDQRLLYTLGSSENEHPKAAEIIVQSLLRRIMSGHFSAFRAPKIVLNSNHVKHWPLMGLNVSFPANKSSQSLKCIFGGITTYS